MIEVSDTTNTPVAPPKQRIFRAGHVPVDLATQAKLARELMAYLKALGGDDDIDVVSDAVEGETSFIEAIRYNLRAIGDLTAVMAAEKENEVRAKARQKLLKERIERVEISIATALQDAGLPENKLRMPDGELLVAKDGDPDEVVMEVTPSNLPDEFREQKLRPQWVAMTHRIREVLKKGGTIPGCHLSNGEPKLVRHKPRAK